MRRIVVAGLFALSTSAAGAAGLPEPVIDNARVAVRDISLTPGGDVVTPDSAHPFVIVFLEGGGIRTSRDGRQTTQTHMAGEALYGAKGVAETLQAASGHPRLIVITLKEDAATPPLTNAGGLPPAFPRPGSKKVLENDRVIVWNYTWLPGRPTAMHFHDKDVVVVYRQEGAVASTTPDGQVTVNDDHLGTIRFNAANRIHSEKLTRGQESAIMTELK